MKSLIISLQYHDGDRLRAMALARMIADIEATRRQDVVMWMSHRYDCEGPDDETLKHIFEKFDYRVYRCPTVAAGWPDGCNGLAVDTLESAQRHHDIGEWHGVPWLLMEPDCIPVSPTWIDQLIDAWKSAQQEGKFVVGAWRQSGPPEGHINGNMLVAPDLFSRIPALRDCSRRIYGTAWDAAFAPYFKPHWYWTGLIANRWHELALTDRQIQTPQTGTRAPVLVHGVKDNSVLNYAYRTLLGDDREKDRR